MLKIAICEDDASTCNRFSRLMLQIEEELDADFDVTVFNNGEDFCKTLGTTEYDIVYLDYYMGKMNGYEAAANIRNCGHHKTKIVFISCSKCYVMDLFPLHINDFIEKPFNDERFIRSFKALYQQIFEVEYQRIYLTVKRQKLCVKIKDIIYIDSSEHKLFVHMASGEELLIYDTLSNLWIKLKEIPMFIMPNQSYIVNMQNVDKFNAVSVTLCNGMKLSISSRNRESTSNRFANFMERTIVI